MDHKDIEDRVRAHKWPGTSPELRQRVLSIAVTPPERITWSDRVWFSRGWRLGAAAAAVLVVALDQFAGASPSRVAPTARVVAEARAIEGLAIEAGLPTETAAWLGQRAVLDASRQRATPQLDAALFQALESDTTGGM
jgi:hypothetical protein